MNVMTLINVHVKDNDKKKLQDYVETHGSASMSDFIRSAIEDKMKIEESIARIPTNEDVEIPDYIPKEKYVIFVNGAVVAIGDKPSALAEIAMEKFPEYPFVMKYNGASQKTIEYAFMSLANFYSWKYCVFNDHSFPLLPVELQSNAIKKKLVASIDTAASVCLLKAGTIKDEDCIFSRKELVATAAGIVESTIFTGAIKILDASFNVEFIMVPISENLPFTFLVGRDLLDQLDAYFMGKKQVFLLKKAGP
jgi:hypothetical protein